MARDISAMKQIMRAVLLGDTAVQGLRTEGVEVFSEHSRSADEATRQQPTVVFALAGGAPRRVGAPVQPRQVHLYAYSNTSQDEADRLHVLATEALMPDDAGICHPRRSDPECPQQRLVVRETAGGTGGRNEDVGAYFVRSTLVVWGIG